MYRNILEHSATFCNILKHSETFWNILKHSETFWNVLEHSGTVQICCLYTVKEFQLGTQTDRQTDVRPFWASEQLKIYDISATDNNIFFPLENLNPSKMLVDRFAPWKICVIVSEPIIEVLADLKRSVYFYNLQAHKMESHKGLHPYQPRRSGSVGPPWMYCW